MAENQACPSCLTEMPPDHVFCGNCGSKLALEDEQYWGLRLMSATGDVEQTLPLQRNTAVLGRSKAADIQLADDPTVSLQHVRLRIEGGALRVEDLGAMNGIFRPVSEPTVVGHNAVIRAGGQWLRFQVLSAVGRSPLLSGPLPAFGPFGQPWGRLLRYGHHGKVTTARLISSDTFTVGRTEGDMVISKAATLSGEHFILRKDAEGLITVQDLGSRNGTFLQVEQGRTLNQGESLLLGERLIRFDRIDRSEVRAHLQDSQPPQPAGVLSPQKHPAGEVLPMNQLEPGIEPALAEPMAEPQEDLAPVAEAASVAVPEEEALMPADPETEFTSPAGDLQAPRAQLDEQVDAAVGRLDDDDLDALLDGLPSLRD